MSQQVLKYIDRDAYDLILYEPSAATRAKKVVALADSISTWGELKRMRQTMSSEVIEPIIDHLWTTWDGGNGALSLGLEDVDEDEHRRFC